MSIGRRKVRLENQDSWIFNQMVDAYESRPAYPQALIDALFHLAGNNSARVGDIGAGIGHLSLPLAAKGFHVVALEPAIKMLQRMRARAQKAELTVQTQHSTAEATGLPSGSIDLAIISDAIHFLDPQRAAEEISRILTTQGKVALITCAFSPTPFMKAVQQEMEAAAPRRPRSVNATVKQILKVAQVKQAPPLIFADATPIEQETLEGILRSISFIGPAMNQERYAAFRSRILSIKHEPIWSRTFTLHAGARR